MNLREPLSLGIQDVIQEIIEKSSQGDYIYRGEPKHFPIISSTLYRQHEKEIDTEHFDIEISQKEMLEIVKKYTDFADHTDILTELQHYGGKTNLIDFTNDYLVALFFACDSSYSEDGRVILLDRATRKYQIESPKKNQNNRVISQKSIFVRSPTGFIDDSEVEFVSIPSKLKQVAMEHLSKYHGITTETIYSDIMGFVQNQQKHQTAYTEFYIGYTYFDKGCYEKALKHYDTTINLNPYVTAAYSNRAGALFYLGHYERAIKDCDRALEFNPNDALAYYHRGLARKKRKEYSAAKEDFERARGFAREQGLSEVSQFSSDQLNTLNEKDTSE